MAALVFQEPILTPSNNRLVCYPIIYREAWRMYKNAFASIWKAEEVDMTQDVVDWNTKMGNDERQFIKFVLAFFAASDGIVNENISCNFGCEVQIFEFRSFLGLQVTVENVHSETYSLLVQTLVLDEDERMHLFQSVVTHEFIKRKAEWAFSYMDSTQAEFKDRIVAFACVEGIFFSASFCAIFWLKKRGLMPGLAFSNELISRDEGMHTQFACLMHRTLERPCSRVAEIIQSAVELECEFVTDALKVPLIGLNSASMCDYVKFCGDRLLTDLGEKAIYGTTNPFPWMELISIDGKTNFFEKRVGEYSSSDGSRLKRGKIDEECDF